MKIRIRLLFPFPSDRPCFDATPISCNDSTAEADYTARPAAPRAAVAAADDERPTPPHSAAAVLLGADVTALCGPVDKSTAALSPPAVVVRCRR